MTHSPSSQLIAIARDFYLAYMANCPSGRRREPLGVVVNRKNRRCSLVFKEQSALLLPEVVVPLEAIRAGGLTSMRPHLSEPE